MGLFTIIGDIARGVTSTLEGAMAGAVLGGLAVVGMTVGFSVLAPLLPIAFIAFGLLLVGACDAFAQGWNAISQNITVSYPTVLPFDGKVVSKKVYNKYLPNGSVSAVLYTTIDIVPGQSAPIQTLGDLVNDIVTTFAKEFNYQINFDPTKDFTVEGNTVKWVYNSDQGLFGLGILQTASLVITATPLTANPGEWWDTKKPYAVQFIPLSSSMNGMKIYVIAVLKDGKTNALKGHQIISFDAPAVRIKAQPGELFCGVMPFIELKPYTVYGVPVSEDFKIEVPIKIVSNMPIEEGDILEVYVGSPAPLINLLNLCCSGSDTCPDKYKDTIDCSQFCQTGYYIYPKIFEDTLKAFGYYNSEVIALAKTFANIGFVKKVAVLTIGTDDIQSDGVPAVYIGGFTADGKWEGYVLSPNTIDSLKEKVSSGETSVIQDLQEVSIPGMYTEYEVSAVAYNRMIIAGYASPAVGLRVEDISGATVSEVLDPYNVIGSDDVSGFPLQVGAFNGLVGITSLATQVLFIPYINDQTDSVLYAAYNTVNVNGNTCQVDCGEAQDDSVICKTAQQVLPYFCTILKQRYPLGVLENRIVVFNPTLIKVVNTVKEALLNEEQQQ